MNDDYLMTLLGISIIAVIISLTITTPALYRKTRYQKIDKEIIKSYLAMSTWLFLVIWAVSIIIEPYVSCESRIAGWLDSLEFIPWC